MYVWYNVFYYLLLDVYFIPIQRFVSLEHKP
jgi:hypothetical protein